MLLSVNFAPVTVLSDLVDLIVVLGEERELPAVRSLYKPRTTTLPERPKKFGVVALTDGSCGFFFAGLDDTLLRLDACDPHQFTERATLDLVKNCLGTDPLSTAVGLGVLNAVSQHLLKKSGFELDRATDPLGRLDLAKAHHVGMVGFFSPLIKLWGNFPGKLTVIEKDPQFLKRSGPFEVTDQTDRLRSCDRVLITGSTLINDTLDDVLGHCDPNAQVALVGPSACCLPDPIFERGVDVVGSTMVSDLPQLMTLLEAGEPWHRGTTKYCITRDQYPGIGKLIPSP